jgi:hypothetical protein
MVKSRFIARGLAYTSLILTYSTPASFLWWGILFLLILSYWSESSLKKKLESYGKESKHILKIPDIDLCIQVSLIALGISIIIEKLRT